MGERSGSRKFQWTFNADMESELKIQQKCDWRFIQKTFQIPFPAVTICSESKADIEKLNLSRAIWKYENSETLTEEESIGLEVLYQICDDETIPLDGYDKTDRSANYTKLLEELSIDFLSGGQVSVAGQRVNTRQIFHKVITGEGVCYSFNMLDHRDLYRNEMHPDLRHPKVGERSDWTIFGYSHKADALTYPTRILGSGKKAGMKIRLRLKKKDVNYGCKGATNGFRLTLHTPDEIAGTAAHFYQIPFDVATLISVQPRVMATSKNLRDYSPKKRQCFFPGERRLKFFKHYTQSNCKLECLAGKSDNLLITWNTRKHF